MPAFVFRPVLVVFAITIAFAIPAAESAHAQLLNTTVQLPVVRRTSFSGSFSIPDGGTLNIGGVGRQRFSSNGRGSFSRPSSRSGLSVRADVIRQREIERRLLADLIADRPAQGGVRFKAGGQFKDPNGPKTVQAQANFLTKNMGRSKSR